ncbi:hypothetical protein Asera_41810 [Actinocatenispora sera]|uniref:Uncharacterized protein n=1 Tax=Actinocatenispora sera TaxID=390989 RepID=A0A810L3X0_9ACTN|nr:hypothetical protein Asera_41810 [Actinocatenispora sera]
MYLTLDAYRRLLGQVARLADTVELVCDADPARVPPQRAARAYAAPLGLSVYLARPYRPVERAIRAGTRRRPGP